MKLKKPGCRHFVMSMGAIVTAIMIVASSAAAYQITQITDDESQKLFARISDSGQVVWLQDGRIHLFDGFGTIVLSHSSMSDARGVTVWDSDLIGDFTNDSGQVVWSCYDGNDDEIFMYNGSEVVQLTDNTTHDYAPIINNSGRIVWLQGDRTASKHVMFYDGKEIVQLGIGHLFMSSVPSIQLNDRGDVLWEDPGYSYPKAWELFSYAEKSTAKIGYGQDMHLNNNGQVAGIFDNNEGKWPADYQLKIHDGTFPVEIDAFPAGPIAFNDLGQIAWWALNKGLFFYDGEEETLLYDGDYSYWGQYSIRLNEQGQVSWLGKSTDPDLHYVFLYDGGSIKTIGEIDDDHSYMDNSYYFGLYSHFNDKGQLAWPGKTPAGYEINFYDGSATTKIFAVSPLFDMNSKGELTWFSRPGTGAQYQVFTTATWNNPAVFDTIPALDVFEGEILDFTVNAIDPDGDNLSYSASGLPAGATFDSISGTFTWLTDNSDAGTYLLTFTATDDGVPAMSSEIQVDITVIDVLTAPELIVEITSCLTDLNLPKQDMNAYMANLKKVEGLIAQGKTIVAVNQLNAFIIKVEQDIKNGDEIAENGEVFISLAEDLITLLENQ